MNCGVKYLYATDADKTQLTNAAKTAIQSLAPESQDYVTQIQDLPRPCRPRRPRRPLPTAKTGECVPPAG